MNYFYESLTSYCYGYVAFVISMILVKYVLIKSYFSLPSVDSKNKQEKGMSLVIKVITLLLTVVLLGGIIYFYMPVIMNVPLTKINGGNEKTNMGFVKLMWSFVFVEKIAIALRLNGNDMALRLLKGKKRNTTQYC